MLHKNTSYWSSLHLSKHTLRQYSTHPHPAKLHFLVVKIQLQKGFIVHLWRFLGYFLSYSRAVWSDIGTTAHLLGEIETLVMRAGPAAQQTCWILEEEAAPPPKLFIPTCTLPHRSSVQKMKCLATVLWKRFDDCVTKKWKKWSLKKVAPGNILEDCGSLKLDL